MTLVGDAISRHQTALRWRCGHPRASAAGTFPVWDLLFGTFRMPEDRLPDNYGTDEPAIPHEITGQLAYPFRQ